MWHPLTLDMWLWKMFVQGTRVKSGLLEINTKGRDKGEKWTFRDQHKRKRKRWTIYQVSKRTMVDNLLISGMHIYIYIYVYVVELFSGPRFASLCAKSWSTFCIVFAVCFRKSRCPCRKKRITTINKNNTILRVENWSNLLRNILGPVLTYTWTSFL